MDDKIKIIDEIVKLHPALGVEKGWAEYTGGMKDSGSWFFRKMLNASIDELNEFLSEQSHKRILPPSYQITFAADYETMQRLLEQETAFGSDEESNG